VPTPVLIPGSLVNTTLTIVDANDSACVVTQVINRPFYDAVFVPYTQIWQVLHPVDGIAPEASTVVNDPSFQNEWFKPAYVNPLFTQAYAAADLAATPARTADAGLAAGPFVYGGVNAIANPTAVPPTELTTTRTTLSLPASGSRNTAYFRTTVTTDATVADPYVEFVADDGFVLYFDGRPVHTYNLPFRATDTYTATTTAAGNSTTNGAEGVTTRIRLYGVTFQAGVTHTLALSVHQSANTSSDLGFAMRFTATSFGDNPIVGTLNGGTTSNIRAATYAKDGAYTAFGSAPDTFRILRYNFGDQVDFYSRPISPVPTGSSLFVGVNIDLTENGIGTPNGAFEATDFVGVSVVGVRPDGTTIETPLTDPAGNGYLNGTDIGTIGQTLTLSTLLPADTYTSLTLRFQAITGDEALLYRDILVEPRQGPATVTLGNVATETRTGVFGLVIPAAVTSGANYQLQTSDTLLTSSWVSEPNYPNAITATSAALEYFVPLNPLPAQRFYRVIVVP
jgi:hypothetical protein